MPFLATALSLALSVTSKPYIDGQACTGVQAIPGTVQLACYDVGGEGLAYHDTTEDNKGSGELNPADGTYLNEFRLQEGVDTSYVKYHDTIDNSTYDRIPPPPKDQLYVGWTEPGEWFRVTVQVAKAGDYAADLLYTSNRGGTIALDIDGKRATEPLTIISTFDKNEPIAWRQWHHWNIAKNIAKLHLHAGRNVLTVHVLTEGQMNLSTLTFHKL